jgi:hypothetical protein
MVMPRSVQIASLTTGAGGPTQAYHRHNELRGRQVLLILRLLQFRFARPE